MMQFINGNNTQFDWLKNQIQEALITFNDVSLPASCTPNRCRMGFEFTQENGYKMYIEKNISFSGNHPGFRALLTRGETSFNSYEDMIMFIRGLGSLYNTPCGISLFGNPQPQYHDNNTLNYTVTSPRRRQMNFTFKYEKIGSIWRAYIINSPSYGSRSTGAHDTHRLNDGRYYVCWSPEPTRLDEITQVSKMWADATAKYIDTGRFG